MKKQTIRTIAIFTAGIISGVFLYLYFSTEFESSTKVEDSLFVADVYAAPIKDEINDDLSQLRQNSITRAVKKLSPAVVGINITQVRELVRKSPFSTRDPFLREFFPELFKDRSFQEEISQLGSGFIISPDGYILTNEHVVENATEIVITMTSGEKEEAKIVGVDPISDVALLKIERSNLPYITLGNSDNVILGEWAIAAGNPFGLFEIGSRATVTVGVISALNRDFGEMSGRIYQDMIQTDASINHGNSGGPLSNAFGEVIGMNTFIYTGGEGSVGIGFAIPINRISNLIDDLKKYQKIDRDFWIGIRVKSLNSIIAKKMGFVGNTGVLVTYIDKGSPAEKAGMQLGDIIIKLGDTDIYSEKNVTEAIFEEDLRVGDSLTIKIWRDAKTRDLKLQLVSIKDF